MIKDKQASLPPIKPLDSPAVQAVVVSGSKDC